MKKRGFAVMPPDRQKKIASSGGKIAHANGSAHKFTVEEAREAGRKGGHAVSANRSHMSDIGKSGGRSSGDTRNGCNPFRDLDPIP